MPTINGVTVYLSTDAGRLPEYKDSTLHQTQNMRECLVQATDGKKFSFSLDSTALRYQPARGFSHFEVRPIIDGVSYNNDRHCGARTINRDLGLRANLASPGNLRTWCGLYNTEDRDYKTRFDFQFSLTEHQCSCSDGHIYPTTETGYFEIQLYRYQKDGYKYHKGGSAYAVEPRLDDLPVHSKHAAGYDIESRVMFNRNNAREGPCATVSGKELDTDGQPYLTFRFYYRPERYLKHIGLLQ